MSPVWPCPQCGELLMTDAISAHICNWSSAQATSRIRFTPEQLGTAEFPPTFRLVPEADLNALRDAVERLTAERDSLREQVARVEAERAAYRDSMRERFLDWRHIDYDDACPKCDGSGRRSYASTATWRGGIGGQAITADVCDVCWGSGSRRQPGADLRAGAALLARLEKLRVVCESFASTAEAAVAHHRAPKGGQQVPFHGDFANVMPSVVARLEWWARAFRAVLAEGGGS